MKRNNFSSLVKQEMVNRFESVVKEEIRLNAQSIESNQKQLEEARSTIQSLEVKIHTHKSEMTDLFASLMNTFLREKQLSDKKVEDFCSNVQKSMSSLKDDVATLSINHANSLSKEEYEERKHDMIKHFDVGINVNQANIESAKSYNEKMFVDGSKRHEDLWSKVDALQSLISDQNKELEKKIQTFKVDSDGVLQELRIYKKEMFIIDKKIENIYTLIERLQNREGLCHSRE
jgi:hypothetical protein